MNEVISFLSNHYDELLAVIGATVTLATLIVKLTPSTRDDDVLDKIVSFLSKFSLVNTKKDQNLIDNNK